MGTMFAPELVGHVNDRRIGEHPPETLLALSGTEVRKCPEGVPTWNHAPYAADGQYYRVADAAGNPPYPSADLGDLAGVRVVEGTDPR